MTDSCIFCRIVAGEAPARIVWEDEQHVAFLTPWPNTEGFTVLITKEHYPSYAFDLPDDILQKLVSAAKTLGKSIDAAFDDVGRTGEELLDLSRHIDSIKQGKKLCFSKRAFFLEA
jgi:diadenosine tetraphosphate (Ap4A) HIT family hydrolase